MDPEYPNTSANKENPVQKPEWLAIYRFLEALANGEQVEELSHGDSDHPFDLIAKGLNKLAQELHVPESTVQEGEELYAHRVILRIDREGLVTYANWSDLQSILTDKPLPIFDLVDEAQHEELQESLERVFNEGKKESLLCNINWPGKSIRPYSLVFTPLSRSDSIDAAIVICRQQNPKQIATIKLERTRDELRWLERINTAVHESLSLTELSELIVEAYYSFFNGLSCRMYRYDDSNHSLSVISGMVSPVFQQTIEKYSGVPYTSMRPKLEDENVYGQALHDGEIRVESDPGTIVEYLGAYSIDEDKKAFIQDLASFFFIQSLVIIPLKTQHSSLGLLVLCTDRVMKSTVLESLGRFTNQVRLAIAKYRMEDDLEKSRNTYRDLFNRVPVGLYRSTPQGQILEANQALVEMLGFPDHQALIDCDIENLYAHPEERKQLLRELDKEEILRDSEFQLKRYDGRFIWVQDSARIQPGEDGQTAYYEGTLIDITIRKKVEDEMRRQTKLLAEAEGIAKLGSWEQNLQTGVTFWSEQLMEVLGLPPDTKELDEERLAACLHPDDREAFSKSYKSLMAHFDAFKQDVRIVKEGKECFAQLACHVERDKEGQLRAIYGTVLDITELKRAENELAHINRELKRQNANLEQFSYVISHNLRAPVANLIGLASMLGNLDLDKTAKDIISRIIRVSDHLDETIRDLNEILAVRDARDISKRGISVEKVLDKVVASIQNLVEETETRIEKDFEQAPEIVAVEGYIQNILYNLVLNAIKYRKPDAKSVVKVSTRPSDGFVLLSVADNGLGINLSAQGDKIFNLYQRFHLHTEGKGMGLYLVKTQVESMGGKVEVESVPGKGTTFYVHLPT